MTNNENVSFSYIISRFLKEEIFLKRLEITMLKCYIASIVIYIILFEFNISFLMIWLFCCAAEFAKIFLKAKKAFRYIKNAGAAAYAVRTTCFFDNELTISFLNSTRIIKYEDIKSIKQIRNNVWIETENEYIYMLLKDELQNDWKKYASKIEETVNKSIVIYNKQNIKLFLLRTFITILLICIIHCGFYKTAVYVKIMNMSDKYYEMADDSVNYEGYYAEKAAYKDLSWAYRRKISFNDYKNLSNDAECMNLYKKIIGITPPASEKYYSILSSGKRGVAYDKLEVDGKIYIVKHTFEFNAGYIMCKPYISRWLITIEEG